ncbi:MAG: DUF5906 domain-containing protein [Lachnospiraceae bacterium]|nr:DUF5906 domain-containing protein [Lachnospiraceae bacterium]
MSNNLSNHPDTTVVNPASSPVANISWDQSACVREGTREFIKSLSTPVTLSNEELRDGCMNAIKEAIVARNLLDSGSKVRAPHKLPNCSIADLILIKYIVRRFSWTGEDEDGCMAAIYQSNGPKEGLYRGDDAYFQKLVREFEYTANRSDVNEVINILEGKAELVHPCTDQDVIPFNNGIFNYKTKQLLPFSPDLYLLRKSKVNYPLYPVSNPQITMPDGVIWDFDSFIASLSDDPEIQDLILKVCGAVLRPNVRWDHVVCLSGNRGMNGKGTLCELLRELCGEGAYAGLKISQFSKDSLVAQLITSIAVISDENDTNATINDVANFKAAATGDSISIDRKYKSSITFKFSGLIVECVNALPNIKDNTESFLRRLLMIPFEKTFKGIERKYIKANYIKRPEVLEYVVWKTMNMPDYYEFPEPDACIKLLEKYKEHNDTVLEFVKDVFPDFAWEKVPQTFVIDLYYSWCRYNHVHPDTNGSTKIKEKIQSYVSALFPGKWAFHPGDERINKKDNLNPELMIYHYGLDNWRSSTYKGTDPAKISMTVFKKSYKNVYERI